MGILLENLEKNIDVILRRHENQSLRFIVFELSPVIWDCKKGGCSNMEIIASLSKYNIQISYNLFRKYLSEANKRTQIEKTKPIVEERAKPFKDTVYRDRSFEVVDKYPELNGKKNNKTNNKNN